MNNKKLKVKSNNNAIIKLLQPDNTEVTLLPRATIEIFEYEPIMSSLMHYEKLGKLVLTKINTEVTPINEEEIVLSNKSKKEKKEKEMK